VTVLPVVYAISNAANKIKCKENMQILSDAPTYKAKDEIALLDVLL